MNEIYILRHGHAIDASEAISLDDFTRTLTDEGRKKIKNVSLLFNSLEADVHLVLSSPYLRAKETAEIFVSNLDLKPELKIVDFLSCGASYREIAQELRQYSSYSSIMVVGHAPDLETFLGKLIGAGRVNLKKGALAKVALGNNIELSGELEWLITPKLIKRIKKSKV